MKINNEDIKKITRIKQYFLDPPVTFKLNAYAIDHLNEAIAVLNKYPEVKHTVEYLNSFLQQLQTESITGQNLRIQLKNAGIKISKLTSK